MRNKYSELRYFLHTDENYELPPFNVRDDIGLSDQDLVQISTKDLNKLFKKKNISKERRREIKLERRTFKNRGYAATCRVKRDDEEEKYVKAIAKLKQSIYQDRKVMEEANLENQKLKDKYQDLHTEHKVLMKEYEENEKINRGIQKELDKDLHMKNLLANRTEIKWERVKE